MGWETEVYLESQANDLKERIKNLEQKVFELEKIVSKMKELYDNIPRIDDIPANIL